MENLGLKINSLVCEWHEAPQIPELWMVGFEIEIQWNDGSYSKGELYGIDWDEIGGFVRLTRCGTASSELVNFKRWRIDMSRPRNHQPPKRPRGRADIGILLKVLDKTPNRWNWIKAKIFGSRYRAVVDGCEVEAALYKGKTYVLKWKQVHPV